jgi:hypothetical protein
LCKTIPSEVQAESNSRKDMYSHETRVVDYRFGGPKFKL